MSGRIALVLLAALVAAVAGAGKEIVSKATTVDEGQTPARGSLTGVWEVTEQSSRVPGAAWTAAAPPYRSLYIFTATHYSYMYTLGSEPRRRFAGDPNQPTDAEKVAAYGSFVAGSGTYTLSGSTLTLNAILHKNPNEMGGEPLTFSVENGANRLQMTIVNPPFSPGRERRTVLMRVE
jgi:Lipocalin-like domain